MRQLHLLNGDSTLHQLQQTDIDGDTLVWRDILCEGPTTYEVGSKEFWAVRSEFMSNRYAVATSEFQSKSIDEFHKLTDDYDEIILWFEYDLFCQINMVAMLSFLHQKDYSSNISLICVGDFEAYEGLVGLGEIDSKYYLRLFTDKLKLSAEDLAYADNIWKIYCSKDHTQLYQLSETDNRFVYLRNALLAHKRRFYSMTTGLSEIETKTLLFISVEKHTTKSLVGNLLRWDEYYGFGDSQYFKVIEDLSPLILKQEHLSLNEIGRKVLAGEANFSDIRIETILYGGANPLTPI